MPLDPISVKYEQKDRPTKSKSGRSCFGLVLSLIILITLLGIATLASLKLAISPIKQHVDNLPHNFPIDLAIYQVDQAQIEASTQTSQQAILKLVNYLPDWILNPLLEAISDDLNYQLVNTYNNFATSSQQLSLDDLKHALSNQSLKQTQTIALAWQDLDIQQSELLNYYQTKLAQADYNYKENITDYEINLGFWKQGVFGHLNLQPDQDKTDAILTVNYLNP